MKPTLFLTAALALFAVLPSGRCAPPPVKVACVGDSITEGAGLGDLTYPIKLGKLLGAAYEVHNYGLGGRTLLKKGDYPYWNESYFQQSKSWGPDIVIIKLGTNDSKPQNWCYGAEYVGDYEEFIASYAALPSHPRILLATPCPVFGNGAAGISRTVVADEIAPAVRDLVTRLDLELIDYHERMAGLDSLFPDTIHPNARGTTVMAALAYEAIVGTDPEPSPPALSIKHGTRWWVLMEWPVEAGGYVLQERAELADPRYAWTVISQAAVNDGDVFRLDARITRRRNHYRLWRP